MSQDMEPIVGVWYCNTAADEMFTILEVDEDNDLLEIQLDTGDLDQIALSNWKYMALEMAAEPENWDGAVDDLLMDGYDMDLNELETDDWNRELTENSDAGRPEDWI